MTIPLTLLLKCGKTKKTKKKVIKHKFRLFKSGKTQKKILESIKVKSRKKNILTKKIKR